MSEKNYPVYLNIKEEGDTREEKLMAVPALLARMLYIGLRQSPELNAHILGPVVQYCENAGVDCGELKNLIEIK